MRQKRPSLAMLSRRGSPIPSNPRGPYLVGVLVQQVQGVPGELEATAGVTVNQKGVLVAYSKY